VKKPCGLKRSKAGQRVLSRPRQFDKILRYHPFAENCIDSVSRRSISSRGDTARSQVWLSA
jgi:hypothetical protein